MPVYLDNNASTHLDPRVLEAMLPYLSGPHANPSSVHRYGRMARDAVEAARHQVARLVNAQPQDLVWTSGGTESNNLAVKGAVGSGRVLYGATEHPAVMEAAESLGAEAIAVNGNGHVRWPEFEMQIKKAPVKLVSLMRANNETGVIQDVARAVQLARAAGALMHVDAVQAAGKIAVDFAALDCDLMSLSSHKLYGPKGIGALVVRSGTELRPLHHGGPQERGLRGGTENVAGIVGFGVAAELALDELERRQAFLLKLRTQLEAGLKTIAGLTIFAVAVERLPNTVQFGVEGFEGEALLLELDKRGMAVSSGSACASGSREPSHVLLAMGLPRALAQSAIRVSLGQNNTEAEVAQFLVALKAVLQ
ncbi:MAG: cysteine desulfurase family protein [Pseudomonadota bacterium]